MKTPFPLFARLVLWFFVNLLILGAGLLLVARIQFGSMNNWLLPQSSQDQVQAMCVDLIGNLTHSDRSEWAGKLNHLGLAYKMEFALYDSHGQLMEGADLKPPEKVRRGLMFAQANRPPPPRDAPPPQAEPPPPPENANGADRPPDDQGPPGENGDRPPPRRRPIPDFPKTVLRTDSPDAFWLLVRFPPEPFHSDGPITLVGMTTKLGDSPLLFNPYPWVAVAAGVVIFSLLFWLPLARNLTTSIVKMTKATESIAEGRFDIQLAESRRDELGRLGNAINRMAVRLKSYVTGQKRFLGDAAHELCSPLARMELALSILEEKSDPQTLPYLKDVREEVAHMQKLANELLNFSKISLEENRLRLEPVNVAEIVHAAVRLEKMDIGSMEIEIAEELYARGNFQMLERAVANLLRNAMRYAGGAGPISVQVRKENDFVFITVADQGPGVAADDLEKLFDPFYRVDASRTSETGGVGLGLAIVKTCVEACDGVVSAGNRKPAGLEVQIRLDRVPKP